MAGAPPSRMAGGLAPRGGAGVGDGGGAAPTTIGAAEPFSSAGAAALGGEGLCFAGGGTDFVLRFGVVFAGFLATRAGGAVRALAGPDVSAGRGRRDEACMTSVVGDPGAFGAGAAAGFRAGADRHA